MNVQHFAKQCIYLTAQISACQFNVRNLYLKILLLLSDLITTCYIKMLGYLFLPTISLHRDLSLEMVHKNSVVCCSVRLDIDGIEMIVFKDSPSCICLQFRL